MQAHLALMIERLTDVRRLLLRQALLLTELAQESCLSFRDLGTIDYLQHACCHGTISSWVMQLCVSSGYSSSRMEKIRSSDAKYLEANSHCHDHHGGCDPLGRNRSSKDLALFSQMRRMAGKSLQLYKCTGQIL